MNDKNEMIGVTELKVYLRKFKEDFLNEFKTLLNSSSSKIENKWLKSTEVKEILHISHGKLQTMRKSGAIPYAKIGGSLFYDREDIMAMFNKCKINNQKVNDINDYNLKRQQHT